jgi:acyl-CoA synthetase (AMP-forming)/AMP-acid ligase II
VARLAGFKVPRYLEVRDELPVNASGRVRKHELVTAGAGRVFDREAPTPSAAPTAVSESM